MQSQTKFRDVTSSCFATFIIIPFVLFLTASSHVLVAAAGLATVIATLTWKTWKPTQQGPTITNISSHYSDSNPWTAVPPQPPFVTLPRPSPHLATMLVKSQTAHTIAHTPSWPWPSCTRGRPPQHNSKPCKCPSLRCRCNWPPCAWHLSA